MKIEFNSFRMGWRIYDIEPNEKEFQEALKWKDRLRQITYDDIIKFGMIKKENKKKKRLERMKK